MMEVESNLMDELQRARHLVATCGPKPFLPEISLEVRQSLAKALSSEESIDHLTAAKRLHRPLVDEPTLWEEYPDIAEWLDELDADDKEAEVLQQQYQEECEARLQEALASFQQFMSKGDVNSQDPQETKAARRTLSKDDLQVGLTVNQANELRRRPSFMADTSQGHIEVDMETTCLKKPTLPVTSTPHVPHKRKEPRLSAVAPMVELFGNEAVTDGIRPRAPSLTRANLVRGKTFELNKDGDEDGAGARVLQGTFVATGENNETQVLAGKTMAKEPNATVLMSSNAAKEAQTTAERPGNVPRIAGARGRPVIAPRAARESNLQGPGKLSSKIQVLPSKASSGLPARSLSASRKVGPPSKDGPKTGPTKPAAASSGRATTGIARPSKPGRLPLRK